MKIKRIGLSLYQQDIAIGSKGSANIILELENDNSYSEYVEQVHVGWFSNQSRYTEAILQKKEDEYVIPAEVYASEGVINFSVGLIKDDQIIKTNQINYIINPAPNGSMILPSIATWQKLVKDYVDVVTDNYTQDVLVPKTSELESLVQQASELVGSVIKFAGASSYENLPEPSSSTVNNMYSITNDFVTDNRFIDGAGIKGVSGTNIVVILKENTYYYDILASAVNLQPITNKIGSAELTTTSKDLSGAVNELNGGLGNKVVITRNPTNFQLQQAKSLIVIVNNGTSAGSSAIFSEGGNMQIVWDVNGQKVAETIVWNKQDGIISHSNASCSTFAVIILN